MIRIVVVAAAVLLLYVLMQVDVTVPALSLIGLVLWAIAASVLAVVLYRRGSQPPQGEP